MPNSGDPALHSISADHDGLALLQEILDALAEGGRPVVMEVVWAERLPQDRSFPLTTADATARELPFRSGRLTPFPAPQQSECGDSREDSDGRLLQLQMKRWSGGHPFLRPLPLSQPLTADPLNSLQDLEIGDTRTDAVETGRTETTAGSAVVSAVKPGNVCGRSASMHPTSPSPLQALFPLLSTSRLPCVPPEEEIFVKSESRNAFFGCPTDQDEPRRVPKNFPRRPVASAVSSPFQTVPSSLVTQASLQQSYRRNASPALSPCPLFPRGVMPHRLSDHAFFIRSPDSENVAPSRFLKTPSNVKSFERMLTRKRKRRPRSSAFSDDMIPESSSSASSSLGSTCSEVESELPCKAARKDGNSPFCSSSRSPSALDTSVNTTPDRPLRVPLGPMSNKVLSRKSRKRYAHHLR